jgi:hypothetical protein
MERGVQEIELPGGGSVLAAVRVLEPGDVPAGGAADGGGEFEDTGALDALSARVERLEELVGGLGTAVLDAARAAGPDEVSATFGIEIGVKPGKAVAMLADGEAKSSISVTLTWYADRQRPARAAEADAVPGQTSAAGRA